MEESHLFNFYINRNKELEDISYGLTNYNSVLILGEPGIGKTTLVKLYADKNPLNYSYVNYFRAYEFEFDESKFSLLNIPSLKGDANLTIIDGIDEIQSNEKKEKILRLVREGRKYGHKVILTSRPSYNNEVILNNSHIIRLASLSEVEILKLIRNRFAHGQVDEGVIEDLKRLINFLFNTPLGVIMAATLLDATKLPPGEILKLLNEKIDYKDQTILEASIPKIISVDTPKIISDVKIINSTLIESVRKNPSLIYSLTSRQFEEFVADLFEKDGYKVSLTKQTHDGGKDMFIVENKRIGKFLYYVECKKYSPNNPVGVRLIRELYGTVIADRATAGLLVTSSYFSEEAKVFTEQIKAQMSLIEFADLKNWLAEL